MTIPDVDSVDDYGGALTNAFPVTDPTTDQDADAMNECKASTAGMTHTAARAWCRFVAGTSPTLATLNSDDAVWGNALADKPAPGHSSTGVYAVTWPTSTEDELGASHTTNLRWARASIEGSTLAFAQANVSASNVVTVRTWNAAGSANDLTGITILVEAG